MFRIEKEFSFEAAHFLTSVPTEHKCSRLHGHGYRVQIVLENFSTDKQGFVVDYTDLNEFGDYIKKHLDHYNLNDVFKQEKFYQSTTAENLAWFLFKIAREMPFGKYVQRVGISETQKTWAWFINDTWEK